MELLLPVNWDVSKYEGNGKEIRRAVKKDKRNNLEYRDKDSIRNIFLQNSKRRVRLRVV
jgi:hypothetical protein